MTHFIYCSNKSRTHLECGHYERGHYAKVIELGLLFPYNKNRISANYAIMCAIETRSRLCVLMRNSTQGACVRDAMC